MNLQNELPESVVWDNTPPLHSLLGERLLGGPTEPLALVFAFACRPKELQTFRVLCRYWYNEHRKFVHVTIGTVI